MQSQPPVLSIVGATGSGRSRRWSCGSHGREGTRRDSSGTAVLPGWSPLSGDLRMAWPKRSQRSRRRDGSSTAAALTQFAVAGVIAVVLLAVVGVALLRDRGTNDATEDAKRVTRLVGVGVVEPVLSDALALGDKAAIARVDRTVRRGVLRDPVVRVKIWSPDGRIVYSDEPRLIGSRYSLGEDDRDTLHDGGVDAEVSDLSRPENRFERSQKKLLEVYLPIHTP